MAEHPHICKCCTKHVPKPLEYHKHHVWPVGEGGPDTDENLLLLCPTMHANVHKLWRLYEKYNGRPEWRILKAYSEYAIEIVEAGRELRRQYEAGHASPTSIPKTEVLVASTITVTERLGA